MTSSSTLRSTNERPRCCTLTGFTLLSHINKLAGQGSQAVSHAGASREATELLSQRGLTSLLPSRPEVLGFPKAAAAVHGDSPSLHARAQAAMALTVEQRAELLAVAEAMVARLAAMFNTHRVLLQDLRELPFAASGIHPQSAAVWSQP